MAPLVSIGVFRLDADEHGAGDPAGPAAGEPALRAGRGEAVSRGGALTGRRETRGVLAEVLGCLPEEVPLWPGPAGTGDDSRSGAYVCVAHRGAHYAVGAATACSVGVDIVRVGAPPPRLLVDRFLPRRARHEVTAAPPHAQPLAFALWWCRMMAAVRACGAGLEDAERSLALAPQRTAAFGPDLVVGVAGVTGEPFDVRWHGAANSRSRLAGVGP